VLEGCASGRQEGTWITFEVKRAWLRLYELGHAHSIEVWCEQQLVGGMYGLALGQIFCGESMFSRQENASKTALWVFAQHFQAHQGRLIDCQVLNPHTASLGAVEIPRVDYLQYVQTLAWQPVSESCWHTQTLF